MINLLALFSVKKAEILLNLTSISLTNNDVYPFGNLALNMVFVIHSRVDKGKTFFCKPG